MEEVLFESTSDDGTPAAPTICSDDFGPEDGWQQGESGTVWWNIPAGATKVAYELMDTPDQAPSSSASSLVNKVALDATDLHEGVQYLAVQFKNDAGWGAVGYYRIQIDVTAPKVTSVAIEDTDGSPVLIFNTTDAGSGVARYELTLDGTPLTTVSAADVVNGYLLDAVTPGSHTLMVVAHDGAGNTSTTTTALNVPETQVAQYGVSMSFFKMQSLRTSDLILLLGMIIIACLFFVIRAERRRYQKLVDAHIREMAAAYKHAEDNFATLRAELYRNIEQFQKKAKAATVKKAPAKKKVAKKKATKKAVRKVAKKTPKKAEPEAEA